MHKKIVLNVILSITLFTCFSQTENKLLESIITSYKTQELISEYLVEYSFPEFTNILNLNQIGNENELVAIQQLQTTKNYVFNATQIGDENYGYIKQQGNKHFSILQQKGNLNKANLFSQGAETLNIVQQEGNSNIVNSLIGNNQFIAKTAISVQTGNSNQLNLQMLDLIGANEQIGILVLQDGHSNIAELSLESYGSPYLKVEQMNGAKISIKHSDFAFPMK